MLISFYCGGNILLEVELKRNIFIIQNERINQYLYFTHKYWLNNNLFQERVFFFLSERWVCENSCLRRKLERTFVMNGPLSGSIRFLLFIADVAFFLAIWHSCWRRRGPDERWPETKNSHCQSPCPKPKDPAFGHGHLGTGQWEWSRGAGGPE